MPKKKKMLAFFRKPEMAPDYVIQLAQDIKDADERGRINHGRKMAKLLGVRPTNPMRALRYRPLYCNAEGKPEIKAWQQTITQEQLANLIGYTQGAVSKIEAEILIPDAIVFFQLLEHGAKPEDIVEIVRYYGEIRRDELNKVIADRAVIEAVRQEATA